MHLKQKCCLFTKVKTAHIVLKDSVQVFSRFSDLRQIFPNCRTCFCFPCHAPYPSLNLICGFSSLFIPTAEDQKGKLQAVLATLWSTLCARLLCKKKGLLAFFHDTFHFRDSKFGNDNLNQLCEFNWLQHMSIHATAIFALFLQLCHAVVLSKLYKVADEAIIMGWPMNGRWRWKMKGAAEEKRAIIRL